VALGFGVNIQPPAEIITSKDIILLVLTFYFSTARQKSSLD
jgi:hypothetical protein